MAGCGISSVYGSKNPLRDLYILQKSLQHRGQESAGFALGSNGYYLVFADYGSVDHVFYEYVGKASIRAHMGIGHNRYSTTGSSTGQNSQPLKVGDWVLGHNGNLINTFALFEKYSEKHTFRTTTDSEIICYMLDQEKDPFKAAERIFDECEGAFNIVAMNNKGEQVLIRDAHAFHPFVWTDKRDDGSIYSASEDIALAALGIFDWKEVPPGEAIVIREGGEIERKNYSDNRRLWRCPVEVLYHMAHGSVYVAGGERKLVLEARKRWGGMLDQKYPFEADVHSYVPSSGLGYAMCALFDDAFSVNRFGGRIFMSPEGKGEQVEEALHLNRIERSMLKNPPIKKVVDGKRILLKDDTGIRINNAKAQSKSLFQAGAKSVAFQIAGAPIRYPCFMGFDHAQRKNLGAARFPDVEQANSGVAAAIADYCGVERNRVKVGYLDIDEMTEPLGGSCENCLSCFTGVYPSEIPDNLKAKLSLD
ncbi:MAG: class II glutamine amidotransferase [Candidatus Aenigmarchaeota archaeon]|nr:class II glutamine amidotransferase [Candidatus Aenigmarchaeota archaeon]